jgi:hypothetical protein
MDKHTVTISGTLDGRAVSASRTGRRVSGDGSLLLLARDAVEEGEAIHVHPTLPAAQPVLEDGTDEAFALTIASQLDPGSYNFAGVEISPRTADCC